METPYYILEIIFGVLGGAFFPLFVFYIIYYIKKHKSRGIKMIIPFIVRILGFTFLFFIFLGLLKMFQENLLTQEQIEILRDKYPIHGVIGMLTGFLAGITLFVIGYKKGKSEKNIDVA